MPTCSPAVLSRYLAHQPDAEFDVVADLRASEALERCLRACASRFAVLPGLAGLAAAMAGAGRRLGRPELVDAALTGARGLFRYAIPVEDGVGALGRRCTDTLGKEWATMEEALRLQAEEVPEAEVLHCTLNETPEQHGQHLHVIQDLPGTETFRARQGRLV